jgi:hypothetical protein
MRLQATPEFSAIAAAAAPLALKEQIVRVERALPRLEQRKSMRAIRSAIGTPTITPELLTSAEKPRYESYLRREDMCAD